MPAAKHRAAKVNHFPARRALGATSPMFNLGSRKAKMDIAMRDRIAVNPQIHFGKPCVAGTRVPVQSVLELVREGIGFADITRDYYPDISFDDIRACVQYAIDVVSAEEIHLSAMP
jgi:uncharacterized protein (DUF433 family)